MYLKPYIANSIALATVDQKPLYGSAKMHPINDKSIVIDRVEISVGVILPTSIHLQRIGITVAYVCAAHNTCVCRFIDIVVLG
ncbi:hypothetical protein [Nitrosomonas sp. Is79A3]|uniref:hypothetical protein n=1 Tax=Nitrosomonas sp. (strain Is79A3) TaxID=261292 RepID=UPI0032976AE6